MMKKNLKNLRKNNKIILSLLKKDGKMLNQKMMKMIVMKNMKNKKVRNSNNLSKMCKKII